MPEANGSRTPISSAWACPAVNSRSQVIRLPLTVDGAGQAPALLVPAGSVAMTRTVERYAGRGFQRMVVHTGHAVEQQARAAEHRRLQLIGKLIDFVGAGATHPERVVVAATQLRAERCSIRDDLVVVAKTVQPRN